MTTNKNEKQQTYRLLIVSLFLVLAAFFCFSNKSFAGTKKTTLKKTIFTIHSPLSQSVTISIFFPFSSLLFFIPLKMNTANEIPKIKLNALL